MDLYNTEKRVLSTKKKFKDTCKNCFNLVEKFERSLKLNDYSSMRILKYWNSLRSLHSFIGKCFVEATREDLEKTLSKVTEDYDFPILKVNDFEHFTPNTVLTVGTKASIDADNEEIEILEGCVK